MPLESCCKKISEPTYYHREYKNDIGEKAQGPSWTHQCQRIATVALPFFSLYKPLSLPISLGMGTLRTFSSINQLLGSIQQGNGKDIPYQLLQTTIAAVALGSTIFAHPAGMLITTAQDLMIETISLVGYLQRGEHKKALESCANIVNNALYLALFSHGGLELTIASLTSQIMLGIYHSHGEFQKGNYLEASGHLVMAMIRGKQLVDHAQTLQVKWNFEGLLKQAEQVMTRYSTAGSMPISEGSPRNTTAKAIRLLSSTGSAALVVVDSSQVNAKAIDIQDNDAWFNAIRSGEIGEIQKFIRAGIDVNVCELINGYPQYTALMYASEMGRIDIVRTLLDAGANVNQVTFSKKCALTSALRHPRILECLIEAGANVNIRLSQRQTPLHFAVLNDNTCDAVCILIKNGANVNAADLYGRTPLHSGIYYKKIALALLDNGADLYASDDKGWKPLHYAYEWGNIDLLKELIKRGASLNEFSPAGCNALHHAVSNHNFYVRQEHLRLIKWLIEEQKMNINEYCLQGANRDPGGLSVLMMALGVQARHEDDFEILNYLLSKGADINAPACRNPYSGKYIFNSTLAWAQSVKLPRFVIDWLVQHGAKADLSR
jgi:ankyrin repeat protein